MLRPLAAGHHAVLRQKDGGLVVLVDHILVDSVALGLNKVPPPHDRRKRVIQPYQFRFGRATRVQLVPQRKRHSCALSERHHHPRVSPAVPMHAVRCVYPPAKELHIVDSQPQLHVHRPLQVLKHALELSPVVLIWLSHARRQKRDCRLDIRPRPRGEKEQLRHRTVELLRLFLGQKSCEFLRTHLEKMVRRWGRGGAGDVFGEIHEDLAKVFDHRHDRRARLAVIQVHSQIIVHRSAPNCHFWAVDACQVCYEFRNFRLVHVRDLQVVHVPYHRHLLAVDHLVGHAGVVRIDHKPVILELAAQLPVEKQRAPQQSVDSFRELHVEQRFSLFARDDVFPIHLRIDLHHQFHHAAS